ncbi:TIGR03621 family F420-dependent LLM class oxidoreductase [Tsukamurella sputi]|uniref:TIGR03621 family F420-dependent LLM class oxidoreductase n=1 Tax=Tsukamurella sputi TaxID=2591848 RepID=UPI001E38D802|nr:TIGR03621 family F420-dependent LLM class oxidoreductase [Tsukamurella sputi]
MNIRPTGSRRSWVDKCRRAESLGFDVIGVPDHLGMLSPFPAVILAAEVTERPRLNTFVLNTPFYNPVLLARDVATVDLLTDGRLELGLGAGYVEAEFAEAGITFPTARRRVDQVRDTASTLRRCFAADAYRPRPVQAGGPPLLIAGWGDRMLEVAAEHADIVALTSAATSNSGHLTLATEADAAARIARLHHSLSERADAVDLNILVQALIGPRDTDALAQVRPHLGREVDRPDDYISLLTGTEQDMAEQLRRRRDAYGINYITVLDNNMDALAPIIELLKD